MYQFTLPYPPSVNRYWRRSGTHMHISKEGRQYRDEVAKCVEMQPLSSRLSVKVDAYMPDRRRRDIDNILKALLDAMKYAGVYEDDEQIDLLTIERCGVKPPGEVKVHIAERAVRIAA